ncbi:BamA/TamA family outer membrane protein [bacterium]|nr:BamA/TamA family outer membrane protein [bacterium]
MARMTHPHVSLSMLSARLLALILIAAIPAAALADDEFEGKTIREIVFSGLTHSTPQQMQSFIKTSPGQPYHALAIRADLNRLAREVRTAAVDVVALPDGGLRVTFRVAESPVLNKIFIRGNEKIKTAKIEKIIDKKPGDKIDEDLLGHVRTSILNEYRQLGMPQAEVRVDLIEPAGKDQATTATMKSDLQVLITEGTQTQVKDVIIQGNEAFTATRLRMNLVTKGSLGFIKNYYNETVFDNDLTNLREFYMTHGYYDARVERGVFEEQKTAAGKALISPVIRISEGRHYRFGPIRVRGVHMFSQDEADAPFKDLPGKYFDGGLYTGAVNKLKALYYNHGLLTTQFRESFEREATSATLAVTIDVAEGRRIHVGKVNVVRPEYPPEKEKISRVRAWYEKRTPPVDDDVIRQEILLKPGDVYNKKLERDSVRRLARLNTFDTQDEKLKAYNKPTSDPDIHDMVVELQDKTTGLAGGGVGYGDATGPYIFGRIRENNVGGRADIFDTGILLGTRDSRVSMSYFDRHFGGGPDSLQNTVFYQTLRRPGYNAKTGGYNIERGHDLGDDQKLYILGRLEYVALSEAHHVHAAEDLDQSYPVLTGRLRWVEDTRGPIGSFYNEGRMQAYSAEAGYAGAPLLRLETDHDRYTRLSDMWTWRLAASAGMMPYDRETVPIHERYFLGGAQDMRGFAYRGAGYFDKKDDDVPIGGAAKVLVKNELIRPLFDPLAGVLFVDVGDLGRSPVSWQVPRVSTGAGLRFNLRQVQVAVDLAMPLVTQDHDNTQFFHFSMQGSL